MKNILLFRGVGTLLLRNPYAAIVSYWNHAAAIAVGRVDLLKSQNARIARQMKTPQFREFLSREIESVLTG